MSEPGTTEPAARPVVLVVEHEDDCSADHFEEWLAAAGVDIRVVRPYAGESLVGLANEGSPADGLLVLGGSMGANDDALHAWLPGVRRLLADAVSSGLPTLGICLGAQLLAVACGGRVEIGGNGIEAGVVDVTWGPAARDDTLCAGLPDPLAVPSMHLDAVTELPPNACLLGGTEAYPNQVFRVGAAAWGVQFHPEVSQDSLVRWADHDAAHILAVGGDAGVVARTMAARADEVATAGRLLATRFAETVHAHRGRPGAPRVTSLAH